VVLPFGYEIIDKDVSFSDYTGLKNLDKNIGSLVSQ